MPGGLPIITIAGRMVADPELRFGQTGTAVASFRVVAASRRKDDRTGEWYDDKTLWMDCTAFRQLAENVCESLVKGDLVTVTGKLQTDEWEDKETGRKRSKTVLIVDDVGPSLQFRTVRHGEGKPRREQPPEAPSAAADPWTSGQSDEPPF